MQWRSLILWNLILHSLLIYHCTFWNRSVLALWSQKGCLVSSLRWVTTLSSMHAGAKACHGKQIPSCAGSSNCGKIMPLDSAQWRLLKKGLLGDLHEQWSFIFSHILSMHSVSQWPGDAASAERWLREAEQRGLSPRVTTYTAVVDACATWFDGLIPGITSGAPIAMFLSVFSSGWHLLESGSNSWTASSWNIQIIICCHML